MAIKYIYIYIESINLNTDLYIKFDITFRNLLDIVYLVNESNSLLIHSRKCYATLNRFS